jgi:GT2 family glycosyltransferase
MGRTTIVVVSYNHRAYLRDCLGALDRAALDPATVRLILIDNASADGTPDFVRSELLDADGSHTRGGLPCIFIASDTNLGFAGGNNLAFRRAIADGDEFVYMLNPDTEAEPGFLAQALAVAASDPKIALVQSLLLRHPASDVVNTYGNVIHYLGFGYAAGDGQRLDDPAVAARLREVHDIAYPSGAGALARVSALARIGLLNEELFAYHEDLELGWRARLAGYRVVFAPASRVHHKYEFSRNTRKFYWMERNRFLVMAWCYDGRSLLLVLPALAAMEAGLWLFALRAGWWREKARAYGYFLAPGRWPAIAAERRRVQGLRALPDSQVADLFTGEVIFPAISPWLLEKVGNPIFAAYWRLVRQLLP